MRANRHLTNSNELTGLGVFLGAGTLSVAGLISYTTVDEFGLPSWTGPAGLVGACGACLVASLASKANKAAKAVQAEADRVRDWDEQMRPYRSQRIRDALWKLADDMEACLLWSSPRIGLGHAPDPRTGDPGAWPVLLPWPDPPAEYTPDRGHWWIPVGARVRLELPQGYSVKDLAPRLPNIAAGLDVPEVSIAKSDGNQVVLDLKVDNPLDDTQVLPEMSDRPDPLNLGALWVGMVEDGLRYLLALRGNHVLLAGLTGAGKSSALWSLLVALAPAMRAGLVRVHTIDLKRGTELSAGARLYDNWAWNVDDALSLLETLVDIMRARADAYREISEAEGRPLRKHIPTPGDPHHVLFIDEVIALLKIPGKAKTQDRDGNKIPVIDYAMALLIELLTQARALGITVVLATQNAAKEIMELLRDLIPTLIGMRLASVEQERMVFGPGASERGIRCTEITVDQAGTVYVAGEDGGSALRARFFHVTDDDIVRLVRDYGRAEAPKRPAAPAPEPDQQAPADSSPDTPADSASAATVVELRPHAATEASTDASKGQAEASAEADRCPVCGVLIEQTKGGRRRKYCSATHRVAHHRQQRVQGDD